MRLETPAKAAEHALPAFAVIGRVFHIAGKSAVSDLHHGASAGCPRSRDFRDLGFTYFNQAFRLSIVSPFSTNACIQPSTRFQPSP